MLGSGFCVLKWITYLLDFGVYAATIINKRKYWPTGVPGDDLGQYFTDKDVTYVDILDAITEDGT